MTVSRWERAGTYLVLVLFAGYALYPVGWILLTALRSDTAGQGGWHPENFVTAWTQGRFGDYLGTSVLVAVAVVGLATLLSVLAGYAFGTMRFRGADLLFYVLLLGVTIPSQAVVVPLYFDLRDLGLTDTYAALVLPQVAQSVAFGAFWMRAYFRASSTSVVEAARLDGAGHWQILWRVLLRWDGPRCSR